MNFIAHSAGITSASQMYALTTSPERKKMSELAGKTVALIEWVQYTDTDVHGNTMNLVSIMVEEGGDKVVYCTNSNTFARSFNAAVAAYAAFDEDVKFLKVIQGKSRNNRPYLDCVAVEFGDMA